MWILLRKSKFDHTIKKIEEQKNQSIGSLVPFQMFQKFVKDACIIKFIVILMKHFQGDNMVFVIVLAMIEKKKILRDNKQLCAAILTYLSKAFARVPFNLLNAKFNANGFNQEALKLIHSYLSDRSQKVN